MRRGEVLAVLGALLLAAYPAGAENVLSGVTFLPGSGVAMKITNFYETLPPSGFLPVRIEVTNRSTAGRRWEVRTAHTLSMMRTFNSVSVLSVPAEERRTFDLLVPLMPQASEPGGFSSLTVSVEGYGVENAACREHTSGGGRTPSRFLGMGEALSVKNWGTLRSRLEKEHSRSLAGSPLDMGFMPADWRALAGFEIIMLAGEEWRMLPALQRSALLDWVAQGGSLVLCHGAGAGTEGFPSNRIGTGRVDYWPITDDLVDRTIKAAMGSEKSAADRALREYTWGWNLAGAVGETSAPQGLIIAFVIVFAACIGPLNFLVLAPAGRRHRLFWTTPLVSLAATAIMAGYILFSEGTGGRGLRFVARLSLPAEHKAVVWQEQVSRTGVLASSAFSPPEPIFPLPVSLHRNVPRHRQATRGKDYGLDGKTWTGDWFASRSTQAQVFTAIVSTRGRIEIQPDAGGALFAISSFEHPLGDFWYFDEQGSLWHAPALSPGEKSRLEKGALPDFEKWKRAALEPAGSVTRSRLANVRGPSRFFARYDEEAIPSVSSIRWQKTTGILFGEPYLRRQP